jgi:hypothetical protein
LKDSSGFIPEFFILKNVVRLMRKLIVIIFTLLTLYFITDWYFKSKRLTGEKFANKYHSTDFDIFRNKAFTLRGYDNDNPVILFYNLSDSDSNNSRVCKVNLDSNNIVSNQSALSDSHGLITSTDSILILKFASFHFKSLSVDSKGTIKIWIAEHSECPKLVKFENLSDKTNEYADWIQLEDGWFEENLK